MSQIEVEGIHTDFFCENETGVTEEDSADDAIVNHIAKKNNNARVSSGRFKQENVAELIYDKNRKWRRI